MKKYLLFIFWAPLFSFTLIGIFIAYLAFFWTYQGPPQNFEIREGEAFSKINSRLHQQGLISSSRIFHHYVKSKNALTRFQEGTFKLETGLNMMKVLQILTEGTPITLKVTIPEGKNIYEIAKILGEAEITSSDDFLKLAKDRNFLQSIGLPYGRAEGYLYPETYKFAPKSSAKKVIRTMVEEHRKRVKNLDFSHPFLGPHEIIVLASIVEKETGAPQERPLIAGVFLNRLQKRMRLQSDPTTIYGVYEQFNGNLTKAHLGQFSPYNTYKISGLPEGPIANPGLDAIKAVLKPARHDFLFFVSRNDGTHIFTQNYKNHLESVKTFQQTRQNREGKSWRDLQKKSAPPSP